jgi:hypothetical protein
LQSLGDDGVRVQIETFTESMKEDAAEVGNFLGSRSSVSFKSELLTFL